MSPDLLSCFLCQWSSTRDNFDIAAPKQWTVQPRLYNTQLPPFLPHGETNGDSPVMCTTLKDDKNNIACVEYDVEGFS